MGLDGKMGWGFGVVTDLQVGYRKVVCGGWCVERPAWGFSLIFAGFRDFNYPPVWKHCKEW